MPEIGGSGFVLPDTKNGKPRIVVHNRIARSVIDTQRGKHDDYVFVYRKGKEGRYRPIETMNNTGWQNAREELAAAYKVKHGRGAPQGLKTLHVLDLRHTFGRRLRRAAGVPFETRQDLLGHWNGNVTTEYSAAEVGELLEAVERIAGDSYSTPTLTLIRSAA